MPHVLPPRNSYIFEYKSWAESRHVKVIEKRGQDRVQSQGHLLGQGQKVLQALHGQWHTCHMLWYQGTATFLSTGHGLNVDM